MNNPACPTAEPTNATACTLTGIQTTCEYSGLSCRCARAGGGTFPGGVAGGAAGPAGTAGAAAGGNREWQCTATLVCPAAKPTVGDACTPAAGNCPYPGMGSCSCSAQTSKWACRGGGAPGGGGAGGGFSGIGGRNGGVGGRNGGIGGRNGGVGGVGGRNGAAGAPAGTTCPATKPAADSACTGSEACPYAGGGCACVDDKWSCL